MDHVDASTDRAGEALLRQGVFLGPRFGDAANATVIAILVSVFSVAACVAPIDTYTFEIRRGATLEDRLALAKSVATEERLNRLKTQVLQRHPNLRPADLSKMGIQWLQTLEQDKTQTIQVAVVLQPPRGVDGARIVKAAAELLDAEVNGPGLSGMAPDG